VRFKPRKISTRLDVLVSIGGSDRVGGYNAPYVEAWNPVQRQWKQFAKLPNFTKTDYSVCQCKNMIIVTGGKMQTLSPQNPVAGNGFILLQFYYENK